MVKENIATIQDIMKEEVYYKDYVLKLLLEGITPLLMNNPRGMKGTRRGMGLKEIPEPEVAAEQATYRLPDGTLGVPAVAIRKCLIGGAPGLKIGPQAASTVLNQVLGHFPPLEGDELFPLESPEGQPIRDYEIDTRRGVRGGQGVLISRPKVWPWRLRCRLKLTLTATTDIAGFRRDILKVAIRAGSYPGLLDGRPEKIKGTGLWFGKFKVLELEIEPLEM